MQPTEQVYRVQCLRYIDGEPAAIETTHLPAQLFPQIETRDLEHQSLYLIIENIYSRRLERCEEHIGAVTAGHEEAHLLKIRVGFPLVKAQRIVRDTTGAAVEFG